MVQIDLNYIIGFFDADGSIMLCRNSSSEHRTIKLDFSNTKLFILKEIQSYLLNNYNIKGYISTKLARKETHQAGYTLAYSYRNAYNLCKLLTSLHPIKKHRIQTILKYYDKVTNRNGKYSDKQLRSKLAFERLFFWSSIS